MKRPGHRRRSRPISPACRPRFVRGGGRLAAGQAASRSHSWCNSPSRPIRRPLKSDRARRSAGVLSPAAPERGTRSRGRTARHARDGVDVATLLLPHRPCRRRASGRVVDYELASRLSYFLWSSMPDSELLAHAATGDLHRPDVLTGQARPCCDRRCGLATEFAGNWLDFRRFEEHNSVDRERFPSFTNELRSAMFGADPLLRRCGATESFGPRSALRQRHVRQSPAGPPLRDAGTERVGRLDSH